MKTKNQKRKLIVVGGGIAGFTCGIYALQNNFEVTIYEKNPIPGGQCTGWTRDGAFIDGCAHWIEGTNPKSQLFPLWKNIGAFDENSKIYETDYFEKIDVDGKIVTFYSDLKMLYKELLSHGPNDKKHIKAFIKGIKAYRHVRIPVEKPMDMMNPFDYVKLGLKLLPMLPAYIKYTHTKLATFANKFKSETLKGAFLKVINPEYNVHSLLYIMQALSQTNAGVPEGGSLKMALRISNRFKSLGGNLKLNTSVKEIVVTNNKATGVMLSDGTIDEADYIVSSTDAYHTLKVLLKDQYKSEYFEKRFYNHDDFPTSTCFLASYKLTKNMEDLPKMIEFTTDPFMVGEKEHRSIALRSHAFDKTLNKDSSTITVMISCLANMYDYLKGLSREEYLSYKNNLGNLVLNRIKDYYKLTDDEIKFIDITTPLTYERFCNGYKGSYMAFLSTAASDKLMDTGLLKGLDNFCMVGQWLMSPGGMPIALFTGRHGAYRACKKFKMKFKA